jgi:hypothetical protein
MDQLNFEQLRRLNECEDFLWSFVGESISNVISGLIHEVLKSKLFGGMSIRTRIEELGTKFEIRQAEQSEIFSERLDRQSEYARTEIAKLEQKQLNDGKDLESQIDFLKS